MNKADSRLDELLNHLNSSMDGKAYYYPTIKKIIRILTALKSENREKWRPILYSSGITNKSFLDGGRRSGHDSGVINYDFKIENVILNEGSDYD